MPSLRSLHAKPYRAFRDGLDLELRPLTLIYGPNNAGKSSIVRLLGIVHDSVGEGVKGPLDLSRTSGARFEDILSIQERELRRLVLGLTWEDGLRSEWTMGTDGAGRLLLEQLRAESGTQLCWYGNARTPEHSRPERADVVEDLVTKGLVPEIGASSPPLLAELRARLVALRGRVQYLSAVRTQLRPTATDPEVEPTLAVDGAGAQEYLLFDASVREEVQSWFRTEVKRDLRSERVGPNEQRWLAPPVAAPELSVPLVATGEGMTQLLPVLVALALRRSAERPNGIGYYALEEPTTHLHDDLQILLARHLAAIADEEDAPALLLETHARPLLLGVQLAIRERRVRPGRVLLYWVEQDDRGTSTAARVEFDEDGLPTTSGLRTAFADEPALLRELSRPPTRPHGGGGTASRAGGGGTASRPAGGGGVGHVPGGSGGVGRRR
jgi:hypothetical protein